MAKIKTLVLDASVIVKWFNREEHTEKALEVKKQYEKGGIDLTEPELLAYELGNSLRYNPNFGMEDTRQALSALEKLQIPTQPLTGELASRTVESAYLYGLTIYDSAYVALADMMNTTLYTADTELLDKVSKPYVRHLTQL
jgi:predicted nucleic acid-binding protein